MKAYKCDECGNIFFNPEEREECISEIELPEDDDEDDGWDDGSDIGCSDCPDDECTGHCMSCAYRNF